MTVTTIKVDSSVRDRLARIAAEQGRSIGAVVADLAAKTPTAAEMAARREAARDYIRDAFGHEVTDEGLAEARALLDGIDARRGVK